MLGGGGFTGGVYEIGALRALDLLSVNRTVNQFDVYVGTSAGAFVAAAVANGVTPEEMMRVIVQQVPTPFPDARVSALLKPNYREFVSRGLNFPLRVAHLLRVLARDIGQVSAVDIVLGLAEALPSGLYSADGIERYVRRILSDPDRSDDFRLLDERAVPRRHRPRHLRAGRVRIRRLGRRPDLQGGERVQCPADDLQAGARSATTSSRRRPRLDDEPRHRGRGRGQVHRRRQPAGALHQRSSRSSSATSPAPARGGCRTWAFRTIGYQAFKLIAHQRLHELARRWEERYPGVDIILIEPDSSDELMFQTSVMNFTSRVDIARHGFQSVTLKLANDYPRYKRICARHGLDISATRVRNVVKHFEAEREPTRAWRKILEQTTSTLLRQSAQQ